jgi:hypothetical protein
MMKNLVIENVRIFSSEKMSLIENGRIVIEGG